MGHLPRAVELVLRVWLGFAPSAIGDFKDAAFAFLRVVFGTLRLVHGLNIFVLLFLRIGAP